MGEGRGAWGASRRRRIGELHGQALYTLYFIKKGSFTDRRGSAHTHRDHSAGLLYKDESTKYKV